ncbi:MAG: glycosyltransferase family 2 protein [Flavobacteriales bacterium]|nr:glycosyltransferase family 2 protein [Flavobacteriales bacterium]
MTPISAVIITFNEERNIGRCIDSLQEIAEDIVVVDSYSTDKTEEICRSKGVRFVQHPFGGYIEQKNYALTQSRFDHVLSLDADEALSDDLRKSVLSVKENFNETGYEMNRLTNYCGKWIKHTGWYPDRKLRLFDKRKARWAGRNPHDRCELDKGSTTKRIEGDILHYSFYTIDQHLETINKFSSIKAEVMYERGKKARWYNFLVNPAFRFFRDMILKGGFRDGFYGYVIARNSAHSVFLKYVKLKDLYRQRG